MREETLEVNGYKIKLPIGLPEPLTTKVRDSYQTFLRESTNDVRRHLTCFSSLVPPMTSEWSGGEGVLHPFGGLGACAQILDQCFKGYTPLKHTFWDRDPECVRYLKESRADVHQVQDSFVKLQDEDLEPYRAVLLDLSVNTIKTPTTGDMWEKIALWITESKFVWFTDTACHKMHLNHKTYTRDFGREITNSNLDYMTAYSEWLEDHFGITIVSAMAEAGMTYCVAAPQSKHKRFSSIPYV